MEYYSTTNHLHETQQDYIEEAEEDALSLCDFTFQDDPISSPPQQNLPTSSFPSDPDDFEFAIDTEIESERLPPLQNGVAICGEFIPYRKPVNVNNIIPTTTSTQKPFIEDPFCLRSESFNLLRGSSSHFANRSKSVRLPENVSSRKHKVLIGLIKFPARMELSDIKKRQDRIAPVPMFPVADGSQPVVAGGGRRHWSLLRPLRFRSHFVGALARASFSCMSRV